MEFQENISLKDANTFGLDVSCKLFYEINSATDIKHLIKSTEYTKNKSLILGGGSNVLFTENFDGIIIKNNILSIKIISENTEYTEVKVGAGENWHQFVLWSLKNNLSGLENLSLIPGNVGTSPIQNIGAYGVEVRDVITKVEGFYLESGEQFTLQNKECNFGYRNSIFKKELKGKVIISHVYFRLNKIEKLNTEYGVIKDELKLLGLQNSSENVSKAVISIRLRKLPDPNEIGNCGSFFKNPIISTTQFKELNEQYSEIVGYKVSETQTKVAAGWLIDQCGWKGYKKGDVGVHKNQALVLVNYGNAKGKEIISLSEKIQKSVIAKFGIEIHPEVNIIG